MAASVSFHETTNPIVMMSVPKYAVESTSVIIPKPAVSDMARKSFVERAIKSPVLFFS